MQPNSLCDNRPHAVKGLRLWTQRRREDRDCIRAAIPVGRERYAREESLAFFEYVQVMWVVAPPPPSPYQFLFRVGFLNICPHGPAMCFSKWGQRGRTVASGTSRCLDCFEMGQWLIVRFNEMIILRLVMLLLPVDHSTTKTSYTRSSYRCGSDVFRIPPMG